MTYVLTLLVFYQQEGMQPLALFSAVLLVTADIALFYLIFRSGWNARIREPELAIPQIAAALAILCCVAYLDRSTQIIFGPFVLVVFLFGVCRLSTTALAALSIACLGAFLLLILVRGYQQEYPPTFRSDLMQWFILVVALTSVVAVSGQIRKLRKVLEITQYQLEHYEEKAIRDELTGLYNRRQLQIELEQARLRAVLSSVPFCLCLLDIDHFKEINDKCGHLVGDMVLREFAQVARDSIRSSDIFGRYGGDEFMKILPDTDLKGAVMHAERLRVHAHFLDFQKILPQSHISISIGVAQYRDGEDATTLIARADAALYQAKKLGRNRVEWIE